MNDCLIENLNIVTKNTILPEYSCLVKQGKIIDIDKAHHLSNHHTLDGIPKLSFSTDYTLLPGFIDTHIHGIAGADVMDASEDALDTICRKLVNTGTTSFLATTLTAEIKDINLALENINHYQNKPGNAEILGVHLEGPFISRQHKGAHPEALIIPPNNKLLSDWQERSGEKIRLLTFAPESTDALDEFLHCLKQLNILPALGHSGATQKQVERCIKHGATHVTHLFNAMGGSHHRHPGYDITELLDPTLSPELARCTLLTPELKAEIIADTHHLHPKTLNSIFEYKTAEGLLLITDAMRACCCAKGSYQLGEQTVNVDDSTARLSDGTLAGSILTMCQAIQNMLTHTNANLIDISMMASVNPAIQCGVYDRKGSIEVGKDADLVVVDRGNRVIATICAGIGGILGGH